MVDSMSVKPSIQSNGVKRIEALANLRTMLHVALVGSGRVKHEQAGEEYYSHGVWLRRVASQ